jgi:hypothetical protein
MVGCGSSPHPLGVRYVRIRFVGYAADCVIVADLELVEGRLIDLLNTSEKIDVHDGTVEAFEDGRVVTAGDVSLGRGELFAIQALDEGATRERRIQTVRSRLVVWAGPYRIEGWFHGHPGAPPTIAFARRARFIPLTEAEIRYTCAGETRTDVVPNLLVSRDLADRVERARPTG